MLRGRNQKGQNVFDSFLHLLNVKYTKEFSNKYFREHPHKYNLFGLSKMLSDYGVENKGFKTNNKGEAIRALESPFVAHTGGDFVVVFRMTTDRIYYLWQGKTINITLDEFFRTWSGVVLLAETNEKTIEPHYKENRKKEWALTLQKYGLFLSIGLLAGWLFNYNRIL
jgi:ABC-type bacteriocin/lantibiotic exporter with double-glycine peptidase domain